MAKRKVKTLKKIKKELNSDKLLVKEIISVLIISVLLGVSVFYVYTNQKHTVSFDSNGGNSITTRKIQHNKKITKCDIPTKDGYLFLGWYYNDQLFECNQKITKDIMLEAKWEKIIEKQITSLTFEYTNIEVKPGSKIKLNPIKEPNDIEEKMYWSSSDPSIAEVSSDGVVSAKSDGTVEIIVSTENNIEARQTITVNSNAIDIEKITLSEVELILSEGTVKNLTYTIEPINASNKNVKWMSDDTSVVTISKNGELYAKKTGEASIILASMDDTVIAKCKVKVVEK